MTDDEAVVAVKNGQRVYGRSSLHKEEKTGLCPGFNHKWRVIFCNRSEQDVVECSVCGKQGLAACTFDDDFA